MPFFGASDLNLAKLYDAEASPLRRPPARRPSDRPPRSRRCPSRASRDAQPRARTRLRPCGRRPPSSRPSCRDRARRGSRRCRPRSRTLVLACPRSPSAVSPARSMPSARPTAPSVKTPMPMAFASRGALRVTENSMDMCTPLSLGRSTWRRQRLALLPAGHGPQQVGEAVEVRDDEGGRRRGRAARSLGAAHDGAAEVEVRSDPGLAGERRTPWAARTASSDRR